MAALFISIQKQVKTDILHALNQRWLQLCARLQLGQEQADAQWQQLIKSYGAPHRYYHNFSHIYHLLQLWDKQEVQLEQTAVFELAFWLHDIIYEPSEKDNEVKSANWATEYWGTVLDEQQQQFLQDLILSTDGHKAQSNTWAEHFFLDHDLSIFAARPADYEDYRVAIREEYAEVSDAAYQKGRWKILQNFLDRKRLFFTDTFYEKYEKQARENLQKECRELQKA